MIAIVETVVEVRVVVVDDVGVVVVVDVEVVALVVVVFRLILVEPSLVLYTNKS